MSSSSRGIAKYILKVFRKIVDFAKNVTNRIKMVFRRSNCTPDVPVTHLITLPSDIIRKVISVGQESLTGMWLITPRWNALALEHISHRKRLPGIETFSWRINTDERSAVTMRISRNYLDYFGIKKWQFPKATDASDLGHQVEVDFGGLFDHIDHDQQFSILTRILGRCSSIGKLKMGMDVNERTAEYKNVQQSLAGAAIAECSLSDIKTFDEKSAIAISEFIRANTVQQLSLSAESNMPHHNLKGTIQNLDCKSMLANGGKVRVVVSTDVEALLGLCGSEDAKQRMRNMFLPGSALTLEVNVWKDDDGKLQETATVKYRM